VPNAIDSIAVKEASSTTCCGFETGRPPRVVLFRQNVLFEKRRLPNAESDIGDDGVLFDEGWTHT
jgi:hypothetical protein